MICGIRSVQAEGFSVVLVNTRYRYVWEVAAIPGIPYLHSKFKFNIASMKARVGEISASHGDSYEGDMLRRVFW